MALFEPCFIFELINSLENSLSTYPVSTMRVCKVTCKINLVRLNFLKQFLDYVDVSLGAFAFLDASGFIERKIQEVGVSRVVKTE